MHRGKMDCKTRDLQVPFKLGTVVTGFKVLRIKEKRTQRGSIAETLYEVRFGCCGEIKKLNHRAIMSRVRAGSKVCGDCSRYVNPGKKKIPKDTVDERIVYVPGWVLTLGKLGPRGG